MEIQPIIALVFLGVHALVSILTLLVKPLNFVKYHLVLAAIFASGLLEVLEKAKLQLGSSEIKVTGAMWLLSLGFMVVFAVLHGFTIARIRMYFIRHYGMFILMAIIIQLLVGSFTFTAALHFLELIFPFIFIAIAMLCIKNLKDIESMTMIFVWYSVVLLVQLPVNYAVFGYHDLNVLSYSRVMSTSLLPALFLFAGYAIHISRLWLVPAACLFAIPLFTISRGVTAAVIVSLVVFGLRRFLARKEYARLALLVLLLLLIAGGVVFNTAFKERSIAEGNVDPLDEEFINTSGRLRIWFFFLEKTISATPTELLIGEGLGASDEFAIENDPTQWFKQPHSEYIRFFYNFGIIGVIMYYAMFFRFLRRERSNSKESRLAMAYSDASTMLIYSLLVLSLYENFLLYNPFGFPQNAFLLLLLTNRVREFSSQEIQNRQ